MLTTHASPSTNCFVIYDGSGNISGLLGTDSGAALARYEYSPFGELIRASGPMARANPFGFSTKFQDRESGLVYFGYRYYSPGLARWITRDLLEEDGGLNLFCFLHNGPPNYMDPDGRTALQQIKGVKKVANIYKHMQDLLKCLKNPAYQVGGSIPVTRVISGGAYAVLYAATAVAQACVDILTGGPVRPVGSIEANAADFVVNSVNGNTMDADLDAVTLAAQVVAPSGGVWAVLNRGYAESDALVAWGFLGIIEDNASN